VFCFIRYQTNSDSISVSITILKDCQRSILIASANKKAALTTSFLHNQLVRKGQKESSGIILPLRHLDPNRIAVLHQHHLTPDPERLSSHKKRQLRLNPIHLPQHTHSPYQNPLHLYPKQTLLCRHQPPHITRTRRDNSTNDLESSRERERELQIHYRQTS
jgi:hypothetical protein